MGRVIRTVTITRQKAMRISLLTVYYFLCPYSLISDIIFNTLRALHLSVQSPASHHLLPLIVVIRLMSQGNLFLLLSGQSLSISMAVPDGGIQNKVIGISLQPGQQAKHFCCYVSVCHMRMHTGTAAAAELMMMKGIHLRSEEIASWVSF